MYSLKSGASKNFYVCIIYPSTYIVLRVCVCIHIYLLYKYVFIYIYIYIIICNIITNYYYHHCEGIIHNIYNSMYICNYIVILDRKKCRAFRQIGQGSVIFCSWQDRQQSKPSGFGSKLWYQ